MTQKEQIRQEIERLQKYNNSMSNHAINSNMRNFYDGEEDCCKQLISFIDSLPEEASCIYDTNELSPTPSVSIEDVARVQFASHAHVFDRKRKAVFDWEQFKEIVGIFYGFGKRDSLPEENNPEPYNPVYDEDYLNEKIAKATKSWEGVDVDAYMDEVRGREPEQPSEN